MHAPLPTLLVPGLVCTPRLYADQIPALWRFGPVILADHTRDDTMGNIAQRILASAPERFTLVGLSMGGYVAFEILRLAPERVAKLALLDTTARPDTSDQIEARRQLIALTESGRYGDIARLLFPRLVATARQGDRTLRDIVRAMAEETGPDAFVRQELAIMARVDSRPGLGAITCPTLILVGEQDEITPPDRAIEMAAQIPQAHHVVVPDCGHLSTLEQPRAVTQALVELISASRD